METAEKVVNVTGTGLQALATVSKGVANVVDVLGPFLPFISEITNVVRQITDLYATAEHNKRMCSTLLSRATLASSAVNDLTLRQRELENTLRNREFFLAVRKLASTIEKIRDFVEKVSQIKGMLKILKANTIEEEYNDLAYEFDTTMNTLNFMMTAQTQIQVEKSSKDIMENMDEFRKLLLERTQSQVEKDNQLVREDMKEFRKFLSEIKGGIADEKKQINEKIEYISAFKDAWEENQISPESIMQSVSINGVSLVDPPEDERETREKVEKKIYQARGFIEVAVKSIPVQSKEKDQKRDLMSQVALLKQLKECTNIIRFYGVAEGDNEFLMVTEWADHGNLSEYYKNRRSEGNPLDWKEKASFAVDIARGLSFLHTVSIFHHDVRCENILITGHQEAKISNFTLSRKFSTATMGMAPTLNNVRYISPEKLKNHREVKYNIKCEIYSFGVLLWELAEEEIPYGDLIDIIRIRDRVTDEKSSLTFNAEDVPQKWQKVTLEATRKDPKLRPTLTDMFFALNDIHKHNKPPASPHPNFVQHSSAESISSVNSTISVNRPVQVLNFPSPDDDDDLSLSLDPNEFINLMTVKEAIEKHRDRNSDKEAVFNAFKQHEELGDMTAKYYVGYYIYYAILPIHQQEEKSERAKRAASLFKEAADAGVPDALLRYGHCLWSGDGVAKSIPGAITYFQKAADKDNITGMYNIGNLYYRGLGVERDVEKGKRYLVLAALKGQPKAADMCRKEGISLDQSSD